PIAIQNVIDYLLAVLTNPDGRGGVFEIGGPDIMTYGDLMLGYARIRGIQRRMLLLPTVPLWFMALGVELMTPVPYPIAYALIDGLSADSVVKHPEALKIFPEVQLTDFDSATRDALDRTHPAHIERVWDDGKRGYKALKHEGCFIDHRQAVVHAEPEKIFHAVQQLIDRSNRFKTVQQGQQQILVSVKDQIAGQKWIEWRVRHAKSVTYITQTVFFCPHGLPGFLYWYLYYPFHLIRFRGLIRSIIRQSEMQ
ncbi:MAG TPA: DUF2867 domain-containing protein, partial [Anaerolineales bacterium]|nr:DUF2867 domain-containing protein [Anaerolineales bacterium]